MIDALKTINIPKKVCPTLQTYVPSSDAFVLETCQRKLVISVSHLPLVAHEHRDIIELFYGIDAYTYLLETICGLRSKLLAENEIAGQFKTAYDNYTKSPYRSPLLMMILEKLFKDAKEIRTNFLSKIGQQSYAGLARRVLEQSTSKDGRLLIVGSGALSKDLLKLLSKRYNITIIARNLETMEQLKELYPHIELMPLSRIDQATNFSHIVNSVGAEETLFDEEFFNSWSKKFGERIFIDLGNPSVIKTEQRSQEHVYRLEDLFLLGQKLDVEKESKLLDARKAIVELAHRRNLSLSLSYPYGWEDLQFV